ncbi:EBP1, partial [Symbiodinium sp. KB8]
MAAEAVPAGAEEQPAVVELSGDVGTKYRAAADVVQKTLEAISTSQIAAGMKVVDICTLGDKLIEGQCAAQFKSKKIEKGVAFPTCISVNNVTCHFSPLSECEVALAEGDL